MALEGEQRQQSVAKELIGDNIMAEAAPKSFPLKAGGEEVGVPHLLIAQTS